MGEIWRHTGWKDVGCISCRESHEAGFWKAVDIWIQKPHVVNRRLCGATILYRDNVLINNLSLFLKQRQDTLVKELSNTSDIVIDKSSLERNQHLGSDDEPQTEGVTDCLGNDLYVEFCIRKLLPKYLQRSVPLHEHVILDKKMRCAVFMSFHSIHGSKCEEDGMTVVLYAYRIHFSKEDEPRISLQILDNQPPVDLTNGVTLPTADWLVKNLLPKLVKWSMDSNPGQSVNSNSLISMEKYTVLYQQLKQKYGPEINKVWPENTDPQKFVYEDIAIATYLLLLWQQEREEKNLAEKQSFVDLGCGNGLLVHLLNSEGHPGKGIDVRRRKIWNIYGDCTQLEERTIVPSDTSLFPDSDWLIGNHSDELTPWIPVIAARSSYNTRYFVLPCCFHDFNCKFKRKNASIPQYRTYLNYICEIGDVCGFTVEEDCLRIPSTKRVCQIGMDRTYSCSDQTSQEDKIQNFIDEKCQQGVTAKSKDKRTERLPDDKVNCDTNFDCKADSSPSILSADMHHGIEHITPSDDVKPVESRWVNDFQPRPQTELVRNCTTVDYALREHITNTIAKQLIELGTLEDVIAVKMNDGDQKHWNRGGNLSLPKVAEMFDSRTLKQLKNECGGLQTLLRNSHQVFQVTGGVVQLRDWSKMEQIRRHAARQGAVKGKGYQPMKADVKASCSSHQLQKTKLCWFYMNHPDGCPRLSECCSFAHGITELRQRPNFQK
ncbi:probable tRNA (uracil-O(2)-)-methyltransferase [Ptychodera flava]|uniref:probable tRNA (uracil-O(2)-)-methyltransferase n=1 Tax=Ptychodera flava TaxID=63121 RepID=UPI00396A5F76